MVEAITIPVNVKAAHGVKEAASLLGVSPGFIRLEIQRKRITPARVGRRVLIAAEELRRYLRDAQQSGD
jgi:excisionase family DNA binding protein